MYGILMIQACLDTSSKYFFLAKRLAKNYIYACERSKLFYSRNGVLYYDHSEIIQAPVDTIAMDPRKHNAKYFSAYDGIKILTVANIVPSKGHEMFITMARWVSNNTNSTCTTSTLCSIIVTCSPEVITGRATPQSAMKRNSSSPVTPGS